MANEKALKAPLSSNPGTASVPAESSARPLDDVRAILRQARRQAYARVEDPAERDRRITSGYAG
ncbi:MAG: hypothetical protein LBR95_07640 [Azoarcus sp.]|jgi:hypothetical protein|nr:hypothetical protein [Azoarcus sp.]